MNYLYTQNILLQNLIEKQNLIINTKVQTSHSQTQTSEIIISDQSYSNAIDNHSQTTPDMIDISTQTTFEENKNRTREIVIKSLPYRCPNRRILKAAKQKINID